MKNYKDPSRLNPVLLFVGAMARQILMMIAGWLFLLLIAYLAYSLPPEGVSHRLESATTDKDGRSN